MDKDLENALKDGSLIQIEKSLDQHLDFSSPLPLEIHFANNERFERINLPIGIEYHKSYSPHAYLALQTFLSLATHLEITSNAHLLRIQHLATVFPTIPRIAFEQNLHALLASLPARTNVAISDHLQTTPRFPTSFPSSGQESIFGSFEILQILRFLSQTDHFLLFQSHATWMPPEKMQKFIDGSNLERRLFLKEHTNLQTGSVARLSEKITVLSLLLKLRSFEDDLDPAFHSFLYGHPAANSVGSHLDHCLIAVIEEDWATFLQNLDTHARIAYQAAEQPKKPRKKIKQIDRSDADKSVDVAGSLPPFSIQASQDLVFMLLLRVMALFL